MDKNKYTLQQRAKIGKLSGAVGILCNTLLAISKLTVGYLSSSMSVIADALNNFSDAASSVVTLIGFKIAEKPADKEHPYGHARIEYLAGLVIAAMILFIGFELTKNSAEKIFAPSPVNFSRSTVYVLIASVTVKLFMAFFNFKLGKRIRSSALLAAAADSRNDVLATGAVLAAAMIEHFTSVKTDGIMGVAVSVFIIYSGISLAKKTISPLLGEGADPDLQRALIEQVKAYPMILGCHDLMVHDYGPGRRYATIHVEVDKNNDPMECHGIIDKIERECLEKLETHLVIHYDPIITNDEELNRLHNLVTTLLKVKDSRITVHDFRMSKQGEASELIFDMVLPHELHGNENDIKNTLDEALNGISDKKYTTNITYDFETGIKG